MKIGDKIRDVESRWTKPLLQDGFTPIADYFLNNYHRLTPPISHSEAIFVIHLMQHKWDSEGPYPGYKSLSKRMGVSPQSARAHGRNLENKKYLIRVKQIGTTNKFLLDPLFHALEKLQKSDASKKLELMSHV